jgi:hypothetical protein
MNNLLVPALVLVVLPALFFYSRFPLLHRPATRALGGGALLVVLLAAVPWDGLPPREQGWIHMLVAAAAVVLLVGGDDRAADVAPVVLGGRRRALLVTAVFGVLAWFNFFAFHGPHLDHRRLFVHLHDTAHYYLGAKYFREVGYDGLYAAMVRAQLDDTGEATAGWVRDLRTNREVSVEEILDHADAVRGAFAPDRWQAFLADTRFFRERLGPRWDGLFRDHGFNPTPLWTLLGSAIVRSAPPATDRALVALGAIDLVLLVASFAAVGWSLGKHAATLALIHFTVVFGATFGWVGGSFLRYLWFAALVGGACLLSRGFHGAAGSLVALSAMLRVFPVLFVVPLALKMIVSRWQSGRVPGGHLRFLAGFGATGLVLLGLSCLPARGLADWRAFIGDLSVHSDTSSANRVGLTQALIVPNLRRVFTADELLALAEQRRSVHRRQILVAVPLVLLLLASRMPRRTDLECLAMGVPLVFAAVNLASYYYVLLVVLTLAQRMRSKFLALILGTEMAMWGLTIFETRRETLCFYRSLLLLWLCVAVVIQFRGADRSES